MGGAVGGWVGTLTPTPAPVSFPGAPVPSSQVTLPGHRREMVKSKSARRHRLGWREEINLKIYIYVYKIIITK